MFLRNFSLKNWFATTESINNMFEIVLLSFYIVHQFFGPICVKESWLWIVLAWCVSKKLITTQSSTSCTLSVIVLFCWSFIHLSVWTRNQSQQTMKPSFRLIKHKVLKKWMNSESLVSYIYSPTKVEAKRFLD